MFLYPDFMVSKDCMKFRLSVSPMILTTFWTNVIARVDQFDCAANTEFCTFSRERSVLRDADLTLDRFRSFHVVNFESVSFTTS